MLDLLLSDSVMFLLGAVGLASTAVSIVLDARAERAKVAVSKKRVPAEA